MYVYIYIYNIYIYIYIYINIMAMCAGLIPMSSNVHPCQHVNAHHVRNIFLLSHETIGSLGKSGLTNERAQ